MLESFVCNHCNITAALPNSWVNATLLKTVSLAGNNIQLPLSPLNKLAFLDLSGMPHSVIM